MRFLSFIVTMLGLTLRSFYASWMWFWFIVPVFHLPILTWGQSLMLMLTWTFFFGKLSAPDGLTAEEDIDNTLGAVFGLSFFFFAIYLIHTYMG